MTRLGNNDMQAALSSIANALNDMSIAINEAAQRNFMMRAELEATRLISQGIIAALQSTPDFARNLQDKLKSAVEADRIISINSPTSDELQLAREAWMKAIVPIALHPAVFD